MLRRKYSRSAYSRAVSVISRLPRVTRARRGIEQRSASWRPGAPLGAAPAQQRPDPRQELLEGERLGEVVVRARVEARDPVGHAVPRGQHQDRRPDRPLLAQRPADREAVPLRQHHVEDDEVVGRSPRGQVEGRRAVGGDLDRIAFLLAAPAGRSSRPCARLPPPGFAWVRGANGLRAPLYAWDMWRNRRDGFRADGGLARLGRPTRPLTPTEDRMAGFADYEALRRSRARGPRPAPEGHARPSCSTPRSSGSKRGTPPSTRSCSPLYDYARRRSPTGCPTGRSAACRFS